MTDWEHPPFVGEHRPRVETGPDGARVTCPCGWHATAETAPKATRAWIAHEAEENAEERA